MKPLFTSFILLFTISLSAQLDTIIQQYDTSTLSTSTEILLKLRIIDDQIKVKPKLKIWLVSIETGKVYHAITNEIGKAYFLLPNGKTYHLNFENDEKYKTIKLPPTPYLIRNSMVTYVSNKTIFKEWVKNDTIYQLVPKEQYATKNRILANLQLRNFSNIPLANEEITMTVENPKTVYFVKTDKDGKARLMLPKDRTYVLNFKYYEKVTTRTYEAGDYINVLDMDYKYFGSKAIEDRKAEQIRALAERDSLYKIRELEMKRSAELREIQFAKQAELREKSFNAKAAVGLNSPFLFMNNPHEILQKNIEKIQAELDKDEQFFEKIGFTICAAMHRMDKTEDFLRTLIVTDLTGSMTPYMNEVLVWHALQAVNTDENQYLFYNDGRVRYKNGRKVPGGGGLFYTDNIELDHIIKTMKKVRNNYSGGDGPENDMEALITASEMGKGYGTVILIADNFSPIKDKKKMETFVRLNIPVKIILAGAERSMFVHEDYLELAYRTGGSIHTLTEDITNLMEVKDGGSITILGSVYRVSRGCFLKR
jgi:hypothetical protein